MNGTSEMDRLDVKLTRLIEGQAATNKWAERIDDHLRTLNGSVAKHEKRLVEIETTNKVREATAEAVEQVKTKTEAKYQRWLNPLIKYVMVAIFILILEHGPEILASQLAKLFKP